VTKLVKNSLGVFCEALLTKAGEYTQRIVDWVKAGKLGFSSGSLPAARKVEPDGRIARWVISEISLVPGDRAAEPRLASAASLAKAYKTVGLQWPEKGAEPGGASHAGEADDARDSATALAHDTNTRNDPMTEIELQQENTRLKNEIKSLQTPMRPPLPGLPGTLGVLGMGGIAPDPNDKSGFYKSFGILRDDAWHATQGILLKDIYGGEIRQLLWEQNQAFAQYIRSGKESEAGRNYLWLPDDTLSMVKSMNIPSIRATMVEARDSYGGFAIPENLQRDALRRLSGFSVIREGGAKQITTATDSASWWTVTGGDARYQSSLRLTWSQEAPSSITADDFALSAERVPVHIATCRIIMSRALVMDGYNIAETATDLIMETWLTQTDQAFIRGDGVGKPQGILPNSTNTAADGGLGLSEVDSGHASTIDSWDKLKELARKPAAQYRTAGRASWIMASATALVIEQLTDGISQYYLRDSEGMLVPGATFLGAIYRESEAMPALGANLFPIIFGDLSGYTIVNRLGMGIRRVIDNDSPARVFFDAYGRIGGQCTETWKLACMQCAA